LVVKRQLLVKLGTTSTWGAQRDRWIAQHPEHLRPSGPNNGAASPTTLERAADSYAEHDESSDRWFEHAVWASFGVIVVYTAPVSRISGAVIVLRGPVMRAMTTIRLPWVAKRVSRLIIDDHRRSKVRDADLARVEVTDFVVLRKRGHRLVE
jgi:hypothetical protein